MGDLISKQAVISTIYDNKSDFKNDFAQGFFADKIRDLPPVTLAEKVNEIFEKRTKPIFGADNSKERYRYLQWLADYNAIKELIREVEE